MGSRAAGVSTLKIFMTGPSEQSSKQTDTAWEVVLRSTSPVLNVYHSDSKKCFSAEKRSEILICFFFSSILCSDTNLTHTHTQKKKKRNCKYLFWSTTCKFFIRSIRTLRVSRGPSVAPRGFETNHHLSALLDFSVRMFSRKSFHFVTMPPGCCTKTVSKLCHQFFFVFVFVFLF